MKIVPDNYAIELWEQGLYYKDGATEFPEPSSDPVLVKNLFSANHFTKYEYADTMCGILKQYTQRDFRVIIVPFYARK